MIVFDKIKQLFSSSNSRTKKAKKNIVQMFLYKGLSILIGLILVPLTLDYVDADTYGIWLALSSMIMWFQFFDIGIGNGLRNRLTQALASGNTSLCKTYVSTTYAILLLITLPLSIILILIAPHIDWISLLNIPGCNPRQLLISITIIIIYFCSNFVLNTINVVILAHQEPAEVSKRNLIQQVTSLILIFILIKTTTGSLVLLCSALCFSPILICALFNITLFKGRYRSISPSIKSVDFTKAKDLIGLGVKFFVIQIAGVIQYQMINFIVIRYYGASEVTAYNISYKYFSMLVMAWGIMTMPIWNAVTDALAKKEYGWIENMQKKYLKFFFCASLIGVIMLLSSNIVYKIWIDDKVIIPFQLSFWVLMYCIAQMFSQIYVYVMNGLGILKVQVIACCFSPIVFLIVCFFGIHIGGGVKWILIAAIICNFNGLILAPIQSLYFLRQHRINKS